MVYLDFEKAFDKVPHIYVARHPGSLCRPETHDSRVTTILDQGPAEETDGFLQFIAVLQNAM